MALSISRPDPTSPASVAEASFSTGRRGFDQDEVRALLRRVATELGRLQDQQRALERDLDEARRASEPGNEVLDADTVTRLLGEETARVLSTARESAAQIKIKAEEGAARILREAADEAARLRQDAEVEVARMRADSSADAEAEVSLAKQQGREMVNEARAYRERVLSELARRRELARQQIEQLIHGRDRLLQVFERARLVAVDVVSDLEPLGPPEEFVDLSPTTGPVPMMVPASRTVPQPADTVDDESTAIDQTSAIDVALDDLDVTEEDAADDGEVPDAPPDATDVPDPGEAAEASDPASADATEEHSDDGDDGSVVVGDAPAAAAHDGDATNVVALFREPAAAPAETDDVAGDEGSPDVDGLFARLRADSAGDATDANATTDATDATDTADTPATSDVAAADQASDDDAAETIFSARDAALTPLIVASARRLKRVLADEQNDVLDRLRGREPVSQLSALVPDLADHAARFAAAIADELLDAACAGAVTLNGGKPSVLRRTLAKSKALDSARDALRDDLVAPLRDRLDRAISDGAGDNDDITRRVRAVYREWKTQHIDDQLDDVFRTAYGQGAFAVVKPGTPLCWAVDPDGPACPDAEDNALAGSVAAGEAFPTGHVCAPAHAGCRCLLAPAPH